MFKMTFDKGRHAPVFTCEVCCKGVLAKDGLLFYGFKENDIRETDDKQIIVHRRCRTESLHRQFLYLHELQTVIPWLLQNCKYEQVRKNAESKAKFHSEISL